MNRPVHFEIHAADPEKLIAFYKAVFGWEFPVWMETPIKYWGVMTGPGMADGDKLAANPGINGGLMKRMGTAPGQGGKTPVNAFIVTVQVDNYDATHEKIMNAGGIVAFPKQAIPGMAWQGYYQDPDGNIFGVHQADKEAK